MQQHLHLTCDNNRVNQSCFTKQFTPINVDTPWIVRIPVMMRNVYFNVYDPVHIFKNIRNNWINEKEKTLFFLIEIMTLRKLNGPL